MNSPLIIGSIVASSLLGLIAVSKGLLTGYRFSQIKDYGYNIDTYHKLKRDLHKRTSIDDTHNKYGFNEEDDDDDDVEDEKLHRRQSSVGKGKKTKKRRLTKRH